jgi:hypothetical protein
MSKILEFLTTHFKKQYPKKKNLPITAEIYRLPPFPKPPAPKLPYHWYFHVTFLLLSGIIGILTIVSSTPVVHTGWNVLIFITGTIVTLGAFLGSGIYGLRSTKGWVHVTPLPTLIAIMAIFFYGLSQTVVIKNVPYLTTSPTAKAYFLAQTLTANLYSLVHYDTLLTASSAKAKSEYQLFALYENDTQAMSKKFLNYSTPVPLPAFSSIVENIGNAAYWQNKALTTQSQNLISPDINLTKEVASERSTAISDILTAAKSLQQIATFYGFTLAKS